MRCWRALAGAALLGPGGCVRIAPTDTGNPTGCDPRDLAEGEVRARQIPCTDECLEDGSAWLGDWIVENAHVRYGIRGAYGPLTRLEGTGGTVVDAAPPNADDALTEATPLLGGLWFDEAEISAYNESDRAGLIVTGTLGDGSAASLTYSLEADGLALTMEGADGLLLVPNAGSPRWSQGVLAGADGLDPGEALWVAVDGEGEPEVEDSGGWIRWSGVDSLVVGEADAVARVLWPNGQEVSGAAEGTWVEALDQGGEVLTSLVVADGHYAGWVPEQTVALRSSAEGYEPGAEGALGADLSLGARGVLRVRVTDERGVDLPATLWWDGEPWPLPEGGGDVPTGPGTGDALLSAGPAYEAQSWTGLLVDGIVPLDAVLSRAATPAVLASLGRRAWPDPTERHRAEDLLFAEAASGVGFAVLTADQEVAPTGFDRHTANNLRASGGVRIPDASLGEPVAWPWATNFHQPAHGAPDAADLDATDLIAAMAGVGARLTVVGPAWFEAAGPPLGWQPAPNAIRLGGLDDLPLYTSLLDAWAPLAAAGPWTWVEGLLPQPYSSVDVGSALIAGRTVATNGPRIVLRVAGQGPGARVVPQGPTLVHLRIEAPAWIPLSGAALVTGDGAVLASWDLAGEEAARLDTRLTVDAERYLLAICWGEEANPPLLEDSAWAVTSPVWVEEAGRPE